MKSFSSQHGECDKMRKRVTFGLFLDNFQWNCILLFTSHCVPLFYNYTHNNCQHYQQHYTLVPTHILIYIDIGKTIRIEFSSGKKRGKKDYRTGEQPILF